MSWTIELLSEERLDGFIDIAEELYTRSAFSHFMFDRDVVRRTAMQFILNPSWLCQVAIVDGKVIGSLGGYIVPTMFSRELVGVEEGLYVREGTEQRAAIASEMMKRFIRFCLDRNCADVRVGSLAGVDNYAVDVFYRRMGFKRVGNLYSLKYRSAR